MMRKIDLVLAVFSFVALIGLIGMAIAQAVQPDVLQPSTWFTSPEAVMAIGAIFASYVVRLTTALGKSWFQTDGPRTRYLAMGIAAVVAGVGGYLGLGYLADVSGIGGAIRAALMTVIGYYGAVAKAEYDRQTLASGAERVEARLQSKLMRP